MNRRWTVGDSRRFCSTRRVHRWWRHAGRRRVHLCCAGVDPASTSIGTHRAGVCSIKWNTPHVRSLTQQALHEEHSPINRNVIRQTHLFDCLSRACSVQGERISLASAVTQEALHVELRSSARAVIKHTRQFGSFQQRLQRQLEHISP